MYYKTLAWSMRDLVTWMTHWVVCKKSSQYAVPWAAQSLSRRHSITWAIIIIEVVIMIMRLMLYSKAYLLLFASQTGEARASYVGVWVIYSVIVAISKRPSNFTTKRWSCLKTVNPHF